ncbi:hypothetical protein PP707_00005 [Acetobacter pasteurianus]|nr:hypothetical protein [Acetobacter pasteurianus]
MTIPTELQKLILNANKSLKTTSSKGSNGLMKDHEVRVKISILQEKQVKVKGSMDWFT